jgi:hypothetical protein
MIPVKLKDWNLVKDSGFFIVKIENPESYYYQFNNGTYSPVIEKCYFDRIPENNKKNG